VLEKSWKAVWKYMSPLKKLKVLKPANFGRPDVQGSLRRGRLMSRRDATVDMTEWWKQLRDF